MLALLVAACFLLARDAAAGLDRRLLLPAGADRVPARYRRHARDRPAGQALGARVDASESLDRLWEVVRELGDVSGATLAVSVASLGAMFGLRRFLPIVPGALIVVVGRSPSPGCSTSRATVSRSSARSRAVCPPDVADTAPCRRPGARAGGARPLPRLLRGRDPDRASLCRQARRARARLAGAPDDGGGERGRRLHAGILGRCERCTNRGERRSRRANPDRRPVLRRGDRGDPPLPDRARAVPAPGRPRRGHRRGGDQHRRAGRLAGLAAIDRVEVAIAAVTTGCVVFFGVLEALVVAVGLSIIDTVRRSARPYDAVLGWVLTSRAIATSRCTRQLQVTPGVVVYRLDDRLFFANAQYVKGRVREAIHAAPTETSWFVFDAEASTTSTRPGWKRSST